MILGISATTWESIHAVKESPSGNSINHKLNFLSWENLRDFNSSQFPPLTLSIDGQVMLLRVILVINRCQSLTCDTHRRSRAREGRGGDAYLQFHCEDVSLIKLFFIIGLRSTPPQIHHCDASFSAWTRCWGGPSLWCTNKTRQDIGVFMWVSIPFHFSLPVSISPSPAPITMAC